MPTSSCHLFNFKCFLCLGVPFVCPNCNELFGNEEYLSQHTDICNISKSDFSSDIHPGKHSDNHNSITSHIRSFSFNHNPPSELKHQEIEQRNDIPSVLPSFVPFCLDATISSSEVFHSLTPQPLENCTHHSNDVLLSSTNHTHSQMAFPSMDEPGMFLNFTYNLYQRANRTIFFNFFKFC